MKFDISKMLKNYRLKNNLSQAEVGRRLGINGMTVSRIENGQTTRFSNELVNNVLELLSLELSDIISDRADEINRKKSEEIIAEKAVKEEELKEIKKHKTRVAYALLKDYLGKFGYQERKIDGFYGPWYTFYNERWNKWWIIHVVLDSLQHKDDALDKLAHYLGNATISFSKINGLSIVFDSSYGSVLHDELGALRLNLVDYDVRVLALDYERERFDDQIALHTSYDGNGLFDLESAERTEEETEEILKEYGKFCAYFKQ